MSERAVPDTATCADLLLSSIPPLMRMVGGAMRRSHHDPFTFSQMRTLEMLRERPWALSDLAARHHVAASTMSRTVDSLVERGLIERQTAADDRRKIVLTLTDAGVAMLDSFAAQARVIVAELLADLSDTERVTLVDGLAVIRRVAQQASVCPADQPSSAVSSTKAEHSA
ncbi:MAG: hypothetical protein Fur005_42810 [Roseiflexaceae bacterium]